MQIHTDEGLVELARDLPVLQDFMKRCGVGIQNDAFKGVFKLFVPYSPWVWAPVRRKLTNEAWMLLPQAFKDFSESNRLKSTVDFKMDEEYSYTAEWQIDAYRRGIFDGIENYPNVVLDKETGRIRHA